MNQERCRITERSLVFSRWCVGVDASWKAWTGVSAEDGLTGKRDLKFVNQKFSLNREQGTFDC